MEQNEQQKYDHLGPAPAPTRHPWLVRWGAGAALLLMLTCCGPLSIKALLDYQKSLNRGRLLAALPGVQADAKPIIAAIEAYYVDHQVLPESLNRLTPHYLSEIPRPGWGANQWEFWSSSQWPKGKFGLAVHYYPQRTNLQRQPYSPLIGYYGGPGWGTWECVGYK